jgi:hypothetical protein
MGQPIKCSHTYIHTLEILTNSSCPFGSGISQESMAGMKAIRKVAMKLIIAQNAINRAKMFLKKVIRVIL